MGRTSAAYNLTISVPQTTAIATGAALFAIVDFRLLFAAMALAVVPSALSLLRTPADILEPMTTTTSAFDTLITEVAAHAATTCPQPLPPPATAEELAHAEQHLGFPLHPLLRRLYTEIANGGFGPEYLLFPLSGEEESITSEYAALTAATTTTTDAPIWPRGVVPILTYGSDMYAGVDCTDPNGAVLLHEPDGNPDDPADTWFLDNESLAAWLQVWIADTGWYREDSDLDEFPQELFLWPAAAARLTTGPASYPNIH